MNKTYDIVFNDDQDSNNKGFKQTLEYCINYINAYNGSDHSYFADYKGGTVSVICNETREIVYQDDIK